MGLWAQYGVLRGLAKSTESPSGEMVLVSWMGSVPEGLGPLSSHAKLV